MMIVAVVAGVAVVPAPRARRGSGDHDPHDGRRGRVARRDGRGNAEAGHRAPRAHAAGDRSPATRVRSYTTAGQTTIFVDLEQSAPPAEIPDVWYQVRKNIGDMRGTLPQGVVGPFFNDDFGDTFGIIYAFTADGFTFRELRDYVESARSRLLQVQGRLEDRGAGRAGRAGVHRVLDRAARRPAARLPDDPRDAAGAEPGAAGRRHPDRAGTRVPARHRRVRDRARHRERQLRGRRPHLPAGRHRHGAARLRRSAAADVPRQRQAGDRPRDRDARRRRHPGAREERAQRDGRHPGGPARSGSSPCWSPTRRCRSTSRSATS